MNPTLAGFQWFLVNIMGISSANLSPTAPVVAFVYNMAINTVNTALQAAPNNDPSQPNLYATAVYNFAGDALVQFAQDAAPSYTVPYSYFVGLRKAFGCDSFVGGVINSTSDEGTSQSMVVPPQLENLTIANLQQAKTPWGRAYLSIAGDYGTLWGIS